MKEFLKESEIQKAYGQYLCGKSLAVVAKEIGIPRGSLYGYFLRRGLKMRSRILNAYREYEGKIYYRDKDGYYREGSRQRSTLHHAIYGEVPEGFVLGFKDGNKENITRENLCLIARKDFASWSKKIATLKRELTPS